MQWCKRRHTCWKWNLRDPSILRRRFISEPIFLFDKTRISRAWLQLLNLFWQKHPHVIFEARTKQNKGCANSGNLEWRNTRRQQHLTGFIDKPDKNGAGRYKRDVRDATKYIETAIIIDKAMFDKRNGSTRAEVVHDAIQVANIADLVSLPSYNYECMNSFIDTFL